jgi:hypothetical protein
MDKNIFNKNLGDLVNDDFAFNADLGKWERQKANRIEQIFIGYNEYPGSYYPKGMSVSIKFTEVEDILNKVLDKYQIQQRYGESTVHSVLHDIADVDYDKFKIEIHDESSFQTVAEEIKKTVEYGAWPFFEKYSTLDKIADLLVDKEPEEIVPYIQGSILFPKTILILKETKHPLYKEKLMKFQKVLEQYVRKEDRYKQMLNVYNDLFSKDLKVL